MLSSGLHVYMQTEHSCKINTDLKHTHRAGCIGTQLYAFNPRTQETGRRISEFKVNLHYRVSLRTARDITQRNLVSKNKNKNKKPKTTKKTEII